MAMTKKQRQDVETLIISTLDLLDKTGGNSDYYKQIFADMSDAQFYKWMQSKFPLKYYIKNSNSEPTMGDIEKAAKHIKVPLVEKITEPFLYQNSNGKAVQTQECLVVYTHLKKVQQFITKKNKWSIEIANRDMKSGRLVGDDKGSATSDREFESLATLGLTNTMEELVGPRADAMQAKNAMYNIISTKGEVSLEDLPKNQDDFLSKNLANVYLLSAHIYTNIMNVDNYTPYSLRKRS